MYTPMELASVFIQTGELRDALDALNQHLTDSPEDGEGLRLRAQVLARLPQTTDWTAAIADLKALRDPGLDDIFLHSVLHERLGDYDQALAILTQSGAALESARMVERRVYLLQKRGDPAAALALVAQQAQTWRWQEWAGDLALQSAVYETAIAHYNAALASVPVFGDTRWTESIRARLLLARAEAALKLNNFDAAERDYTEAERLIPGDPMIVFNRGIIAAQRGDLDTAQQLCRAALAKAGSSLAARMHALLADYPELRARVN